MCCNFRPLNSPPLSSSSPPSSLLHSPPSSLLHSPPHLSSILPLISSPSFSPLLSPGKAEAHFPLDHHSATAHHRLPHSPPEAPVCIAEQLQGTCCLLVCPSLIIDCLPPTRMCCSHGAPLRMQRRYGGYMFCTHSTTFSSETP